MLYLYAIIGTIIDIKIAIKVLEFKMTRYLDIENYLLNSLINLSKI
tara:strand:+ start:11 stop:148 length:138 start_codon:yes stop_codon:yes gene_type:complete